MAVAIDFEGSLECCEIAVPSEAARYHQCVYHIEYQETDLGQPSYTEDLRARVIH